MITKQQKSEIIEKGIAEVEKSKVLIFGDFSRIKVQELGALRSELRKIGAKFRVIKKRLLRIIFERTGISFNPEEFESQVGTVFSDKDIPEAAQIIFNFAKRTTGEDKKERFQILGGLDIKEKKFIDADFVKVVGSLPPRAVLLGQLLGTIIGPAKAFLYVLSEKSKK